MNNRYDQFLTIYQNCRHKDQESFYKSRIEEFEVAKRQAATTAAILMLLTTVVSLLAAGQFIGAKWVWSVLGVFLPALSAALTAYNSLFAFEQQSKLYQDASRALRRADAEVYGLRQAVDAADYSTRFETYVAQIEEILRKEQGQWGQLTSEIKPVEPRK